MDHAQLGVFGQGGGQTLQIDLAAVQSARLQKQLMTLFVGELPHLDLNRRAVAGADSVDSAVVEGRAGHSLLNDPVGALVGVGHITAQLVAQRLMADFENKALLILVAVLGGHLGIVDRPAVDAGRSARLEAAEGQTQRSQRIAEKIGRIHSVGAHMPHNGARVGGGAQIGAGCKNDCGAGVVCLTVKIDPPAAIIEFANMCTFALPERKGGQALQRVAHIGAVGHTVALCAGGEDGRALASIEHPKLQACMLGGLAHLAAEGVDLADKLALCRAADGRVAGQVAHRVQTGAQTEGAQTHTGGSQRGLDACVSRTYHDNIKMSGKILHKKIRLLERLCLAAGFGCRGKGKSDDGLYNIAII